MVTKTCPKCEASTALASKSCTCGHIFISKNSKRRSKDDSEINIIKDEDRIAKLEEKIQNLKEGHFRVIESLEIKIVELVKEQDSTEQILKSIEENTRKEILSVKETFDAKITKLEELIEDKYNSIVKSLSMKLDKFATQVKDLENRIIKLETDDTSSESSESTDEEDVETTVKENERVEVNIPTENRFSSLDPQTANDLSQNSFPEDVNVENNPERIIFPDPNMNGPTEPTNNKKPSRKILLLSDSMLRRIIPKRLSQEDHIIKRYIRGGLDEMSSFIDNFESGDENPNDLVIHTGTNDIPFASDNEAIIAKIDSIIKKSKLKFPNTRITLSGIIHRKNDYTCNDRIDCINRASAVICNKENIAFMDNTHITRYRDGTIDEEVFYDHVHLNDSKGLRKLAANLKKHLHLSKKKTDARNAYTNRMSYRRPQSNNRSYHTYFGRKSSNSIRKDNQVGGLINALKPFIEWLGALQ